MSVRIAVRMARVLDDDSLVVIAQHRSAKRTFVPSITDDLLIMKCEPTVVHGSVYAAIPSRGPIAIVDEQPPSRIVEIITSIRESLLHVSVRHGHCDTVLDNISSAAIIIRRRWWSRPGRATVVAAMISICIIDNIVVAAAAAAIAAIVVISIAVVVIMQTSHIKVGVAGSIDGRHSKSLIEAGVIFQPSLDDFGIASADVDNGGGGVIHYSVEGAQQVEVGGGEDLFPPLNRM